MKRVDFLWNALAIILKILQQKSYFLDGLKNLLMLFVIQKCNLNFDYVVIINFDTFFRKTDTLFSEFN